MKKTFFLQIVALVAFIPATIGLLLFKTFIGAMILIISVITIVFIGNILAIADKKTPIKIVVAVDLGTLLLLGMILAKYYFNRPDISIYICIILLSIATIFALRESRKNTK
jgi:hypothetical protein